MAQGGGAVERQEDYDRVFKSEEIIIVCMLIISLILGTTCGGT